MSISPTIAILLVAYLLSIVQAVILSRRIKKITDKRDLNYKWYEEEYDEHLLLCNRVIDLINKEVPEPQDRARLLDEYFTDTRIESTLSSNIITTQIKDIPGIDLPTDGDA